MKVDVSFIIPSYNEEKNLPHAVGNLIPEIKNVVKSFEIIIVNDGSTDSTGEVAEKIAEKNKHVRR